MSGNLINLYFVNDVPSFVSGYGIAGQGRENSTSCVCLTSTSAEIAQSKEDPTTDQIISKNEENKKVIHNDPSLLLLLNKKDNCNGLKCSALRSLDDTQRPNIEAVSKMNTDKAASKKEYEFEKLRKGRIEISNDPYIITRSDDSNLSKRWNNLKISSRNAFKAHQRENINVKIDKNCRLIDGKINNTDGELKLNTKSQQSKGRVITIKFHDSKEEFTNDPNNSVPKSSNLLIEWEKNQRQKLGNDSDPGYSKAVSSKFKEIVKLPAASFKLIMNKEKNKGTVDATDDIVFTKIPNDNRKPTSNRMRSPDIVQNLINSKGWHHQNGTNNGTMYNGTNHIYDQVNDDVSKYHITKSPGQRSNQGKYCPDNSASKNHNLHQFDRVNKFSNNRIHKYNDMLKPDNDSKPLIGNNYRKHSKIDEKLSNIGKENQRIKVNSKLLEKKSGNAFKIIPEYTSSWKFVPVGENNSPILQTKDLTPPPPYEPNNPKIRRKRTVLKLDGDSKDKYGGNVSVGVSKEKYNMPQAPPRKLRKSSSSSEHKRNELKYDDLIKHQSLCNLDKHCYSPGASETDMINENNINPYIPERKKRNRNKVKILRTSLNNSGIEIVSNPYKPVRTKRNIKDAICRSS